jgi:hypothetical protein
VNLGGNCHKSGSDRNEFSFSGLIERRRELAELGRREAELRKDKLQGLESILN